MKYRNFLTLLSENNNYRNLWVAHLISSLGDWVNTVAVLALVIRLTGSGLQAGLVILIGNLTAVIAGVVGGYLVDRWHPKFVLIGVSIIGVFSSAGYLFINSRSQIVFIYLLGGLIGANLILFQIAYGTLIKQITKPDEYLVANSLISINSGVITAVGALLGGVISIQLGIKAPFIFNMATFIIAAFFISMIIIKRREPDPIISRDNSPSKDPISLSHRGWIKKNYVPLISILSIKIGWALGGGAIVMLVVFATDIFDASEFGTGIFYSSRGIGLVLSAFLLQTLTLRKIQTMYRYVALGFFVFGAGYILFSYSTEWTWAVLMLIIAHVGGGLPYPISDTLKQQIIPSSFLGRVYGWEAALTKVTMSLSIAFIGWASDIISIRWVAGIIGITYLSVAIIMMILQTVYNYSNNDRALDTYL